MTRKSGHKWTIVECPRCNETHYSYSGKIDSGGREYVICQLSGKKVVVNNQSDVHAIPYGGESQ